MLALWSFAVVVGFSVRIGFSADDLEHVEIAIEQKRFDEADEALRRMMARDPSNPKTRLWMGAVAFERQEFPVAIAATSEIPSDFKEVGRARLIEGDAWFRMNRTTEAEQRWKQALNHDEKLTLAVLRLTRLYAAQQRRLQWRDMLWQLYDRSKVSPVEMAELMVWSDQRWDTSVRSLLQDWTDADPTDHHSRRSLALHRMDDGNIDQAISTLNQLRQHTDDPVLLVDLLSAYVQGGRLKEAEQLIEKNLHLTQEHYRFRELTGTLFLQTDRPEKAVVELTVAANLCPTDLPTRERLAQAYRRVGQKEAAKHESDLVDAFLQVRRLCRQLQASGFTPRFGNEMLNLCDQLNLVEEGLGWARLAANKWPSETSFHAAKANFRKRPPTSSRNPPIHLLPQKRGSRNSKIAPVNEILSSGRPKKIGPELRK